MAVQINEVAKQYRDFRIAKLELRRQQKVQFDEDMKPWKVRVGEAIHNARESGFKVDEIMLALGLKNRNFLYECLKAFQEARKPSITDEVLPDLPDKRPTYNIEKIGDTKARVTMFDSVFDVTVDSNGRATDLPESVLMVQGEEREVLREAIKKIQELFGG